MSDVWREFIKRMVEMIPKIKVSDCFWELSYWLMEPCLISKDEMSDIIWEFINSLVKVNPNSKMSDGFWEIVQRLVEVIAEFEVGNAGGKGEDILVEGVGEGQMSDR